MSAQYTGVNTEANKIESNNEDSADSTRPSSSTASATPSGPASIGFLRFPSHWDHSPELSHSIGPFPTRIVHTINSQQRQIVTTWESRRHRKHLGIRKAIQNQKLEPDDKTKRKKKKWYEKFFPLHPSRIPWWT